MVFVIKAAEEALKHWVAKCTETVGELWIGLLKFYALEFDWKTRIVSISRVGANIPKDEKQWNRKLCIEGNLKFPFLLSSQFAPSQSLPHSL